MANACLHEHVRTPHGKGRKDGGWHDGVALLRQWAGGREPDCNQGDQRLGRPGRGRRREEHEPLPGGERWGAWFANPRVSQKIGYVPQGISADLISRKALTRDPELDLERVDVNGGAIAMGHPLGATGCIILGTLLDELERRGLATGCATLCAGAGMGIATVIERV
jgi:hypothetical protein